MCSIHVLACGAVALLKSDVYIQRHSLARIPKKFDHDSTYCISSYVITDHAISRTRLSLQSMLSQVMHIDSVQNGQWCMHVGGVHNVQLCMQYGVV